MTYQFTIHRRLPSLNEYINKCNFNRFIGNQFKKEVQNEINWEIKTQLKGLKIQKPVVIHITWIEENKRRDVDNVYSAIKYIQDSLTQTGVLQNDNGRYVIDIKNQIQYDKESKVVVQLEEIVEKR